MLQYGSISDVHQPVYVISMVADVCVPIQRKAFSEKHDGLSIS